MDVTALHERLRLVAGDRTYRHLGEITSTHPETVRRYMLGMSPSVEFISAMCAALGVNPEWLLTGSGPMLVRQQCEHVLRSASMADIMGEIGERLDKLQERLVAIERYARVLVARTGAEPPEHRPLPEDVTASEDEQAKADTDGQSAQVASPACTPGGRSRASATISGFAASG